jgi:hypothetical protein
MIAGITADTNFENNEDKNWLKDSFHKAILQYHITEGFTSLSPGADQLFASVLSELGIPFTVVIPADNYQNTFKDPSFRASFFALLMQSKDIIKLPHSDEIKGQSMLEMGKFMVRSSQIILSVNDNCQKETEDTANKVISYAHLLGKTVININPECRKAEIV